MRPTPPHQRIIPKNVTYPRVLDLRSSTSSMEDTRYHDPRIGGSSPIYQEAPPISQPVGLSVRLADTNYFSSEAHSGHSSILSCCFFDADIGLIYQRSRQSHLLLSDSPHRTL